MSAQAIADAARKIKELAAQLAADSRPVADLADQIVYRANVILDAPEIVAAPPLQIESARPAWLTVESDRLTLTISSDDWGAWLATLPPSGASVAVQVVDPRSGKLLHTIADIRWPTCWARD